MLALQAQDFAQALWAIGARLPGSTRAGVLAALESGEVVRSWPMRGTLHFTTPADLAWTLQITGPLAIAAGATRRRELGVSEADLGLAADVARRTLTGGAALTRDEFQRELELAGIPTTGQRGYHVIVHLAQSGVVCWGPPRGTQQGLVLLDDLARAPEADPHELLGRFVLRFFTGHGPATIRDFAWWSKATLGEARIGLEVARPSLTEFALKDDPESYWISTSEVDAAGPARAATYALPGFDEYLLGYADRTHVLPAQHASLVAPGGNGIFLPMIVSDGRIVGTWRRRLGATAVRVTAAPFEAIGDRELRRFAASAREFGAFLGLDARLDVEGGPGADADADPVPPRTSP